MNREASGVIGRAGGPPENSFPGHLVPHFVSHFVELAHFSIKCGIKCGIKSPWKRPFRRTSNSQLEKGDLFFVAWKRRHVTHLSHGGPQIKPEQVQLIVADGPPQPLVDGRELFGSALVECSQGTFALRD